MNILPYSFLFCLVTTTVSAQIDPKCFKPKVQDSLEIHYCERGAYRYSYNSKEWQIYLDSLIQICPNIANAYREKAIPDIKRGDWAKAMPLENKTVELDAKHWMDYRAFLKAIFTKDYEGAIIDFEAAEKLHPNDFVMDHSYSFYKGMCCLAMGKLEQAEILFKKDIAVQASSKPHFNSLWYSGVVYYELKDYENAKKMLQQSIAQYEFFPEANYYLALVYEATNDKTTALSHLNIAKQGAAKGYTHNEDNHFYAYYPYEITAFEIEEAIKRMSN